MTVFEPNWTFPTFKNDSWDDSTKSIFLQYIGTFLRKLRAKAIFENQFFKWKLIDELALVNLRCDSAGGVKKWN